MASALSLKEIAILLFLLLWIVRFLVWIYGKLPRSFREGLETGIRDLLQPARKNSDWKIRLAAVGKISPSHQAILAEMAKNDPAVDVRLAAADKLEDNALAQAVMHDIVRSITDYDYCKRLIGRLTEPSRLIDIAIHDKVEVKRRLALERLVQQRDLALVAKNCKQWPTALLAVRRLSDQCELAALARDETESGSVRVAAAKKLTDASLAQAIYGDLARRQFLKEAIENLTDQKLLVDIVWSEELRKRGGCHDRVMAAVANPVFPRETELVGIARKHWDSNLREYATEKISSQEALREIALNDESLRVRMAAIQNVDLTDQMTLFEIISRDQWQICDEEWDRPSDTYSYRYLDGAGSLAMKKLCDRALLAKLARNSSKEEVREAALRKMEPGH